LALISSSRYYTNPTDGYLSIK